VGRGRRVHPSLGLAALAVAITYARPLLADPTTPPTKLECNDAHTKAQPLRRAGQLRAARRELRTCAAPACPTLIRDECAQWLDEVGRAIPTLVLEASDQDGNDRSDVRVTLDGQVLAERLDGNAIEIDPGEHDLVFESQGVAPVTRHVVVVLGEKDRHERVTLEVPRTAAVPPPPPPPLPPPVEPPAPAAGPPPTAPPVQPPSPPARTESGSAALCTLGFGTAGVGLVVGSIAGIVSFVQVASIKSQCDGNSCPHSQASSASSAATVGNVANVAFVAAGAGVLLGVLTIPRSSSPSATAGVVRFAVGPGSLSAQGSF
jgi:hypothetical protein